MIPADVRRAALPLLLPLLLLAASCDRQTEEARPTIPLVREILSDRADYRALVLRAAAPKPASDIAIIGSEFACERLAEQFCFRDEQDNVDARRHGDGLPDFAGETFVCIEDARPYASVLEENGEEELRRQTVLRVLAALDTTVHISPYDVDGLSTKDRSKMVVLADPYLAEYGGFDVDTLLRSTGCAVPVISPVERMIGRAFEKSGRGDPSVAILCAPQFAGSGIYERIFARMAGERGLQGASCVVSGVERKDSLLRRFLRGYLEGGQARPLDAVLIDDLSVNPDSLKFELAEIVSVMNESSMTYGRLIPRDFFFLNAFEEVADCAHDFLRDHNLFTHNIAMPRISVYRPAKHPDADDGSIILIPGSYVQN